MKIKAVCFDMDGVVVDTMRYHVEAWRHAFNKKGYDHDEHVFYLREGMPGKKTIKDVFEVFNVDASEEIIEDIYVQKRNYFKENAQYEFIEETVSTLKSLQNLHIPIALVTGSRKEFVNEVLGKLQITFNTIITGDDVKEGKPAPEPYLLAMDQHPFDPSEWLVIENAPLGIQSAKSAGAYCLAVETTLDQKYLKEADQIVKCKDLERTVESLLKGAK
ncbi:HAD family phosphatase [Fictibacillus sp. b24]|uniref:HAD family hydrolase n=1 Tax=Fictibacillus sp. b24 TaxID=3055863 RepID=UPI0025A111C9|nr:HAD family phosphatase [Fictibacillus sp. b24]MDM5315876.1 HAD family phosphatase [Fictibacillus sp. b24]